MNFRLIREEMPYRSCVGTVVFNDIGMVWAGRRIVDSETPMSHRWQFPQGGINNGEPPLIAARRELLEETGIKNADLLDETGDWFKYDLPDEILGIALNGKYRGQIQKWFAFRFEGNDDEINITNPPAGTQAEFDLWEWKPFAEMATLVVPFKREIYLRVIDEFGQFSNQSDS